MGIQQESGMRNDAGFSMVELLVALAITLVLITATLVAFTDALHANEGATLLADMDQNLRAGMNLMIRDLIQTGEGIPTGGIPIPSGAGAEAINRPSPAGLALTFDPAWTALPAVTPGPVLGPAVLGQLTDIITVLSTDITLPLSTKPLCPTPGSAFCIADNGSSMTVDPAVPITGINNPILPGDLIMFANAQGNAIQTVTSVAGQKVNFAAKDAFNLNQRAVGQGSIMQIKTGATWPPTTATRIWMITYFLNTTTNPRQPRLMRQINLSVAQPVGEVLENLQVSYDIVDGVTNPTNVKTPPAGNSANQIRKVNLYLAARSTAPFSQTQQYLRNNLATQVSLRSLAYVNRYP